MHTNRPNTNPFFILPHIKKHYPKLPPKEKAFLQQIKSIIDYNLDNEQFDVAFLAQHVHLSISQLDRKLNKLIQQPTGRLIRQTRMHHAIYLLKTNTASISEVAYQVGYPIPAHFSRCFKRVFGCSPSVYAQGYALSGEVDAEKG